MTALAEVLPHVNALLNVTATVTLLLGRYRIALGDRDGHRKLMLASVTVSAIFLASYLTRFALTGPHRFPELGWIRIFYLALLTVHSVLALAVVPMILTTLALGLRGNFPRHQRWARITFPIWVFVSVSGVVVYAMLYHLAPALLHSV